MTDFQALIVEDEQSLAEMFEQILISLGLSTRVALDGLDAIKFLEEHTPDIVLLDINLPTVSGDKILQYIRSTNHLSKCKVMIASANPSALANLANEADLVLFKPISVEQLVTFTQRLMSMSVETEE